MNQPQTARHSSAIPYHLQSIGKKNTINLKSIVFVLFALLMLLCSSVYLYAAPAKEYVVTAFDETLPEVKDTSASARAIAAKQDSIAAAHLNYRNNWRKFITVAKADVQTTTENATCELEIMNTTSYLLDKVDIAVQYIDLAGKVTKTEIIPLYNIDPQMKKICFAPAVAAGSRVNIEIVRISCRKMNFLYANS